MIDTQPVNYMFPVQEPLSCYKVIFRTVYRLGIEYSLNVLLTLSVFVKVIHKTDVLILKVTSVEYSTDSQQPIRYRLQRHSRV